MTPTRHPYGRIAAEADASPIGAVHDVAGLPAWEHESPAHVPGPSERATSCPAHHRGTSA